MQNAAVEASQSEPVSLFAQTRQAMIWRSGAQIVGQLITWGATFLVIRILDPRDYGLFAMTQVMLSLLNMLNGAGLARGLIQRQDADERLIRQLYGMLILLNFTLGAIQIAMTQFLWLMQSQADVLIAGRSLGPANLGLYTTSVFLTLILVSKFVPAVNDVAFSVYARLQDDREAVAQGFARLARMVMLVAMPFYAGLAVTAEPLVATVLGPKWIDAAPLVRLLALSMPALTLPVPFHPG